MRSRGELVSTLKQIKKLRIFDNFGKFQKFKTITQRLKFITRHKFISFMSTLLLKTLICHTFFVYLQTSYPNMILTSAHLSIVWKTTGYEVIISMITSMKGKRKEKINYQKLSLCLNFKLYPREGYNSLPLSAFLDNVQISPGYWP